MRHIDIDIETIKSGDEPPDWAVPAPWPTFEEWDDMADAPPLLSAEDVKVPANYKKQESIQKYIDGKVKAAAEARAEFESTVRSRWEAGRLEREKAVGEVWHRSSLDAFLGGRVESVHVSVDGGPVKAIRGRTEADTLALLGRGLRRHDRETNGQCRIWAWNGFGFDFMFICRRAQHLAGDQDLDAGVLSALMSVAGIFWYDVPWRARGLGDPRAAWLQGLRGKGSVGTLRTVAEFYGIEIPEEYHEYDHAKTHDYWVAGETDKIDRMGAIDVQLLTAVREHMDACGMLRY